MHVASLSGVLVAAAIVWMGAAGLVASQAPSATSARPSLPDAPGRAPTIQLCGDCHEIGTILGRRHSPTSWRKIIDDMTALGAVFTDDEVDVVVGYLGVYYGTVNVNTATIEDVQLVLELTPAQARQFEASRKSGQRLSSIDDIAKATGLTRDAAEARKARVVFAE